MGNTSRLGSDSYDQALTLKDSNNCRVTRNLFAMKDARKAYWTIITGAGDDHRIDHNEYADKPSEGCFIVVYGKPDSLSLRTRIDHNYFHAQTFTGENGGECIRFGDSNRQNIDAFMRVEYNLFEGNTGDVEVISNKASSNVIRYNTLRGNRGSIVLRHGDDCLVEGNFLLDGENGIRFYGDKQRIIGNYFSGNSGTAVYSTIAVSNGSQADLANGENTYDQPHDGVVAFNTLVNNKTSLVVGVRGAKEFPPVNLVTANNVIQSDTGTLVDIATAPETAKWQDNILWGAGANGNIPGTGFRRVNPLLVKNENGLFRLTANSPALNSASKSGNFLYLTADLATTNPPAASKNDVLKHRHLRVADVGVNAL
ncbi:MAG: polysaccharide lyase 6 family protein [Pyrinomonadaceae bacterium MAG19_C2-C3]|nr:polysaccharide lyase 6 family protein [Pyrinomonadaceae bacterium MAG19_C2-C3]